MQSKTPLYSFEDAGDYVYDVAWSPVHPALFAAGDGMGHVDFWNLNAATEVPSVRVTVGEGLQAVNRIRWSPQGTELAAGTIDGTVSVYEVGEGLAKPRSDEWTRLKATLSDIQSSGAEAAAASKHPPPSTHTHTHTWETALHAVGPSPCTPRSGEVRPPPGWLGTVRRTRRRDASSLPPNVSPFVYACSRDRVKAEQKRHGFC